jgi:hypothetical protein
MTIDEAINLAVTKDLDILEALPEVHDLRMDELEPYIEKYVIKVIEVISNTIDRQGKPYFIAGDAAGLCATLLQAGVHIPSTMLLKMCQTIIEASVWNAEYKGDAPDGNPVYYAYIQL